MGLRGVFNRGALFPAGTLSFFAACSESEVLGRFHQFLYYYILLIYLFYFCFNHEAIYSSKLDSCVAYWYNQCYAVVVIPARDVDSAGTSWSYLRFALGLTTSCFVAFSCAQSGGGKKIVNSANVGHAGQGRGACISVSADLFNLLRCAGSACDSWPRARKTATASCRVVCKSGPPTKRAGLCACLHSQATPQLLGMVCK